MIKVIITAPKGAMDSMIVEEAWKNPKLEIIGCIGNPKKDYICSRKAITQQHHENKHLQ